MVLEAAIHWRMKKLEWVNQKANLRLTFADAAIKVKSEEKFKRHFQCLPSTQRLRKGNENHWKWWLIYRTTLCETANQCVLSIMAITLEFFEWLAWKLSLLSTLDNEPICKISSQSLNKCRIHKMFAPEDWVGQTDRPI